ncbi:hypothetical protein [Rhodopseudomonas sp. BR0G17]|uniref:hypothetical protein n=1 Tax=Rhodopseudomonas sp. BR0G17 TaxID=2269368 RepID=UPI0013E0CBE1|nr:hypothetical protein [Rhodopseudomonas sp. BR0G17]
MQNSTKLHYITWNYRLFEFLDRRPYLERLARFLDLPPQGARLVIAGGGLGVGKTTLLRHAAKLYRNDRLYLLCDRATPAGGLPGGIPFPELLERQLSSLGTAYGFETFDDFCKSHRWSRSVKMGAEAAASIATKALLPGPASRLAWEAYERIKASRGGNKSSKLESDDLRLLYILEKLKTVPAVVHIDHAHLLDPGEIKLILHLLDSTTSVFFIEFTTAQSVQPHPDLASVKRLELNIEPLPLAYADQLFSSLPDRFARTLRDQFAKAGNLLPYDDAALLRERGAAVADTFDASEDALAKLTEERMLNLGQPHLNALLAISAHAGPVDRNLLVEFLGSTSSGNFVALPSDVDGTLDFLDERLLAIVTTSSASCQPRVHTVVDHHADLGVIQLSFRKLWRDFYRDASTLGIFVSEADRCRQILHQCAVLNDLVGISSTLQEVGRKGINSRNPKSIVNYLKDVTSRLQWGNSEFSKTGLSRIALSQCHFFYDAGWFDQALECLDIASEIPPSFQYLQVELYCATEFQARGISMADAYLSKLPKNTESLDAELCLKLIKMHGLRNSNQLASARDLYIDTVSQRKYSNLSAYPTLLRFADLCLCSDEDLPQCAQYLELAIAESERRGLRGELASSCLALGQLIGYTPNLDRAEALLNRASEIGDEVWLQRSNLLANRAVISLYRGNPTAEDLRLLEQAQVLAYDALDCLLIQVNMLIWHAVAGDFDRALQIEEVIAASLSKSSIDTEIKRIALFNLEATNKRFGRMDAAGGYHERWTALRSGIDEKYWSARRNEIDLDDWRCSLEFYPVYLAHWHLGLVPFQAIGDYARD